MVKKDVTLLIIDDDIDDKEFFIEAIEEIDGSINCKTASNGEEALQLLKESDNLPDYIFLDLNMPRINGKQCLKELKQNDKLSHIPVIIYTTSTRSKDRDEILNMGAVYFLVKPARMQKLKEEINYVFSEKWKNDFKTG